MSSCSLFFSFNEIGLRYFLFLALALSLVSTLKKTLKSSRKTDSALIKSSGGHAIYHRKRALPLSFPLLITLAPSSARYI